jgi:hypothetical protein
MEVWYGAGNACSKLVARRAFYFQPAHNPVEIYWGATPTHGPDCFAQ